MQNLSSVRVISNFAENYLDKQNFFKSLQFKTKSVGNGLVISIPKEDKYLNPLHQDIYNLQQYIYNLQQDIYKLQQDIYKLQQDI